MDLTHSAGYRIRDLRTKLDYSQEEVADRAAIYVLILSNAMLPQDIAVPARPPHPTLSAQGTVDLMKKTENMFSARVDATADLQRDTYDMPALQVGTLRERLVEHVPLAYWTGVAARMGVRVTIEPGSKLLRPPHRYGLDYWPERKWAQQLCLRALANDELDDGGSKQTKKVRGVILSGKRPSTHERID